MNNNYKWLMAVVCCAALAACGKQESPAPAPAPAPAVEAPAPAAEAPAEAPASEAPAAESSEAPASEAATADTPAADTPAASSDTAAAPAGDGSIDTAGLPQECVDYVNRFLACTAKMDNAEIRNGMNADLAENVKEMQSEEDKSELAESCKGRNEAIAKTPMMESC